MARAARLFAFTSLLSSTAIAIASCGGGNPTSDAGPSEGGVDASNDTSSDAAPACHADLDCNDGLYCNGDEHCTAGQCVAGSAPACADTISCTRDFCSEDRRTCVHQVPDADMDGHGDGSCLDTSGVALGDDCADGDANRFPGNVEVCDTMMHDEDCVMTTHGHVDNDSDGFEDAACCNGTDCGNDCDDSNRGVNPSATEVCDHIDDNCDGHVDEGVGVMMLPDADRDGYGDSSMTASTQCGDTVGFAVTGGDCDDMRVDRNPGQLEVCDTVDNDCDTSVDENAGNVPWYVDGDHDGYGDPHGATLVQCAPPTGDYSLVGTDCDDTTSSRSPRAPEVCNAIDDDCNGVADFAITPGDLEDDDRDGVADTGCGLPRGLDCNDRDASALPGAPEICNGRDDDCDTHVDEDATSATFHHDGDMDGFGDPGTAVIACFAPSHYVTDASDCDDTSSARHPGASETCNASDDDCDRRVDETPAASSCAIPGAVAACTVGICHEVGCQPGLSDCTLADGCETSTLADDLHCGGCSTACDPMAEQCAQSRCVPGGLGSIAGVSPRDDSGTAIASNAFQRVIGGTFSGTGFGVGCGTHFDAQGVAGAVVSLRDSGGECLHAIAIDGSGEETVTALAIDSSGTAIYVALVTTSATLSIGSMAANAVAGQGAHDIVIAQLDGSLAPVWVQRFGGTFDDQVTDLVLDGGDLWAVGAMRGPATLGTLSLGATSTTDSVAIHLSKSDGSVAHFATAPSTGMDGAMGVAIDPDHVFVVGAVGGTGSFGTTPITASGPTDAYLWVLARADGTSTSARAFGGSGADVASAIAISDQGFGAGLAISGAFQGTMTVDAVTATAAMMHDGFVLGLDGATFAANWLVPFGGDGEDSLNDITYTAGSFVTVGVFAGMAFVGGRDAGITASGGTDGVAFAVGVTGFPSLPTSIGGPGTEHAYHLSDNHGGAAYIAGDYTSTWTWRGATFPSVGGVDAFWLTFIVPGT